MTKASAVLALVAAAAMTLVKALLAEPLWWPFIVPEYAAAAALFLGATGVLRGGNSHLLAAGWAFTLGITWSTFFHHLAERPSLAQMLPVDFGLALLLITASIGAGLCAAAAYQSRLRKEDRDGLAQ
jgi:hypothetical protein